MPALTPNPGSPGPGSADPLAALRDIHLPAPVSWWPPAPGWWLLAGLLLVALGALGWYAHKRYQRRRYRRAALAELQRLIELSGYTEASLQTINQLLKRCAMVAYPAATVASLHGKTWAQFLQASAPGVAAPANLAAILGDQLYDVEPVEAEKIQQLAEFARHWLASHRPASAVEFTRRSEPC